MGTCAAAGCGEDIYFDEAEGRWRHLPDASFDHDAELEEPE